MSIAKRPSKDGRKSNWQVLIDTRDPVSGKRKRVVVGTFRTKRQAEEEERKALDRRDRGTLLDPSRTTVGELLDEWLRNKASSISPQSLKDYEIVVRRHIKPALGSVLVQKLTTSGVQGQYDKWQQAGMSARQLRGCHLRLSQALDYAVKHQIVYTNVCANTSPPRLPSSKADVWTPEEARRFLDASLARPVLVRVGKTSEPRPAKTRPDELTPLWHLLLLEGMRRGEALGLRWADINWSRGTAHIVQTVAPDKSDKGRAVIQANTKTKASSRTVRLTSETLEILKTHRKRQAETRLAAAVWSDYDLIVCTSKGTPINPNNVTRSFGALVKHAGLRRIRVHDLRHTHATMLLKAGVSAKVVSERLGHASIAITLDTYSHVLPDMQDAAADAVDSIMATATSEEG